MWPVSVMLLACAEPDPQAPEPAPLAEAPEEAPPEWCRAPRSGWQTVRGTRQAPYTVHHPHSDEPDVATVIFLPGGTGESLHAELTREAFLVDAAGLDDLRVVMPIGDGDDSAFDARRVAKIRKEVLTCFGGDPDNVHLAGHSNGGMAAFDAMLDAPEKWASLLVVPGALDPWDEEAAVAALSDKPLFLGVGEHDSMWVTWIGELHDQLTAAGLSSELVVFPGIGHTPDRSWEDRDVLFDWWIAASG